MTRAFRCPGLLLLSVGSLWLTALVSGSLLAQEPPNRREFTIVVSDSRFTPDRIEATQDDLVTITVRSEDGTHSFAIDEYRIVRRVPAGGSTSFEFRADRPGRFPFYCSLTGGAGHRTERGELIVRAR